MSNLFELNAEVRHTRGKAHARRMRRLEDKVPGIVYGIGKDPLSITIDHNTLSTALKNEAIYSHVLTLHLDGKAEQVVLKDLQRHPYKPRIVHIDFLRIDAKAKLTMHVPLHFLHEEEAPGIKDGGIHSHLMTEVEIRCLPANLPEYLAVDVSQVALDGSLHLSDIVLPKGVELTIDLSDEQHNQAIYSIHKSRAAADEDTAINVNALEESANEESNASEE